MCSRAAVLSTPYVEDCRPVCSEHQQQAFWLFSDSEGRVEGTGHLLPPLSQNSCGKEGEQSQQGPELEWRKESGFNPLCVCIGE